MEVLIIGSGGTWAKGASLDAAYKQAARYGSFGKQIVVVVAPTTAAIGVTEVGGLVWQGPAEHVYVRASEASLAWPNRRTTALRAAVDAALARGVRE